MPDGSRLRLRKLDAAYDPRDRLLAASYIQRKQAEGEFVTGLLYIDPEATDCHEVMNTTSRPLNELKETDLCPGEAKLSEINVSFR